MNNKFSNDTIEIVTNLTNINSIKNHITIKISNKWISIDTFCSCIYHIWSSVSKHLNNSKCEILANKQISTNLQTNWFIASGASMRVPVFMNGPLNIPND